MRLRKNALAGPKNVLHSTETTDGVPPSEKALVPMKQEHHDGGTGTGRDEPTTTQGAVSTGIHTTTIAVILYSPYHNYTGSLSTDIPPDAAMTVAESGKTNCL